MGRDTIENQLLRDIIKHTHRCNAMTRDGDPCKAWRNTRFCPTSGKYRCKNHGGAPNSGTHTGKRAP